MKFDCPHEFSFSLFKQAEIISDIMSVPHAHTVYELYYSLKGFSQFLIRSVCYDVHPHTLVLISPFNSHMNIKRSHDSERIVVTITPEMINDILDFLNIDDSVLVFDNGIISINVDPNHVQYVNDLLARVGEEYCKKALLYEKRIEMLIGDLLLFIVRNKKALHVEGKVNKKNEVAYSIAKYLYTFYHLPITLEDLSQRFHIEKTYLCHKFKQVYGITVWDYLMAHRIKVACEMLAYSERKITEVAQACGFGSINHFERIFKKHVKISPSRYRSQSKINPIKERIS